METKKNCAACGASGAHETKGWRHGVVVPLCGRCDNESRSSATEHRVRLAWADDDEGFTVVRELRVRVVIAPAPTASGVRLVRKSRRRREAASQ